MTSLQKTIKYLAIGLAIFIIINMIYGGIFLFNMISRIFDNSNNTSSEMTVLAENITEINTLDISLEYAELEIVYGDEFKVLTNDSNVKFDNNLGDIKIKDESRSLNLGFKDSDSKIKIYLPKITNKFILNSSVQKIYIDNLETNVLELKLGAGKASINNLQVNEMMKLDSGVGKLQIKGKVNNLEANLGVGTFEFDGSIYGNSKINGGIGEVKIKLDNINDYRFKVDKGIGQVKVNGEKTFNEKTYGNGTNYIEVNGGIGSITIK